MNATEECLVGATCRGHDIPVYDDMFGEIFILRDSMGILGIVRAQCWEDAYSICEDEFFPSADEEGVELAGLEMSDYEQACWDEAYGYRPNGRGGPTPEEDHGIYSKDLNGDRLDVLTQALADELEIKLIWEG